MAATKVADQAWIGLALLHREDPARDDFRVAEVLTRAEMEFGLLAPGVRQHLSSHAIATVPPSSGKYRMITRTAHGRVRLFRSGDRFHPKRAGKFAPHMEDVPGKYKDLLRWYSELYNAPNPLVLEDKDGDPRRLMRFVGSITAFDLDLMRKLIAEDCERIEVETGEGKDVA